MVGLQWEQDSSVKSLYELDPIDMAKVKVMEAQNR